MKSCFATASPQVRILTTRSITSSCSVSLAPTTSQISGRNHAVASSRNGNAEAKDRLERIICDMVCGGQLDIAAAQEAIAKDWIAAYHKYSEAH